MTGTSKLLVWSSLAFAVVLGTACNSSPVGDPCVPESIPVNPPGDPLGPTGFRDSERYLETSSVQCRTRVCLVDGLRGDPTKIGCSDPGCVTADAVQQHVYCTCRCAGPVGGASYCSCPDGFVCTQVLESGGVGIVGSYCLRGEPDAGVH